MSNATSEQRRMSVKLTSCVYWEIYFKIHCPFKCTVFADLFLINRWIRAGLTCKSTKNPTVSSISLLYRQLTKRRTNTQEGFWSLRCSQSHSMSTFLHYLVVTITSQHTLDTRRVSRQLFPMNSPLLLSGQCNIVILYIFTTLLRILINEGNLTQLTRSVKILYNSIHLSF